MVPRTATRRWSWNIKLSCSRYHVGYCYHTLAVLTNFPLSLRPKHKSAAIAAGVGVGTFVAGAITVILAISLFKRTRPDPTLVPTAFVNSPLDSQTFPDHGSLTSSMSNRQNTAAATQDTRLIITRAPSRIRMNSLPLTTGTGDSFSQSVFLVHRDGGRAQEVVELPPSYGAGTSLAPLSESIRPPPVPEKPSRYLATSRTPSTSSTSSLRK